LWRRASGEYVQYDGSVLWRMKSSTIFPSRGPEVAREDELGGELGLVVEAVVATADDACSAGPPPRTGDVATDAPPDDMIATFKKLIPTTEGGAVMRWNQG
jgi:hypothetical protein